MGSPRALLARIGEHLRPRLGKAFNRNTQARVKVELAGIFSRINLGDLLPISEDFIPLLPTQVSS